MSAPAVRRVEQARTVAAWLSDRGHHHEAAVVRSVCRSNDSYRSTLSQLHKDNMGLRRQLAAVVEKALPIIESDRACVIEANTMPFNDLSTLDPIVREDVEQYDAVIAFLREAGQ